MDGYVVAAKGKTLTIFLAADLKKFNAGINKAEGGLKGFGNSIQKYLGPALIAATAAAGAFAVKLGVDAVNAASDLIETQNKVSEIFGESTQSILDFASTSVTALGQTEEQALDAAATFAALGKSAGLADEDLVDFSTDLVTLASDLASFNNTSPEQAIEAISSALRGSTKPIRAYKVLLDDASLRQEALALGISDGNSQLSTQQKVLAASSAIFAQVGDQVGDFDRTSEGLANTTRILTAAVNQAKAEIGIGLVDAIEDATGAMGGSQGMADGIEIVGGEIALLTRGVGRAISEVIELKDSFNDLNTEAKLVGTQIRVVDAAMVGLRATAAIASFGLSEIAIQFRNGQIEADEYAKTIDGVHDSFVALAKAERAGRIDARIAQEEMIAGARDSGIVAAQRLRQEAALAPYLARRAKLLDDTTTATKGAAKATETLTKWELKAADAQEILQESEGLTAKALDNSVTAFRSAISAVKDYASAIQGDLLSGIDLGAAFEGQLDDAGKATGIGMVDAFNQQIEQAKWFGNVLTSIKKSGADDTLIQAIASLGPETGGALGQQMIDDGLIPTINEKWVGVQETTASLAMGLVPEFAIAGVASAAEMVTGLAQQLKAEQKTLAKLGKNMAKPVGAAFKSRLAKDVAEAVRNVDAAATAARAEKVANATAVQAGITQQAVSLAIQNIMRRADARAGSVVQPVLT
tara:strand:+ start:880 stop:2973 length:2094 start_codon:yes stop_codon:yes gene_type:complete